MRYGGNRTSRKTYAYTTGTLGAVLETANYSYDGDRILSVGGSSVIYDGIGNPTSYRGNALTWNRRSLLSCGNNTFVYNSDGIRVKKTVNGVEHNYILNDTQIVAEVIGGTKTLYYFYDQNGVPTAFRLDENGTQTWYAYETNVQGDVTGIRTTDGTQVVSYTYDAWGRCTVSGSQPALGALNPLRYRGYYYDAETELYYLNSRYYDPDTGRFLNADEVDFLGADKSLSSYNLFIYCKNNPINHFDVDGNWSLPNWAKVAVGAAATLAAVAVTVATGGAAAPVLIGVVASTIGGAATGAIQHRVATGSWEGAGKAALNGAADGFMTGGLCALGGSVVGGAARTIKNARSGITIGKVGQFEIMSG